jgi:excinuclease ABC subunit C
MSVSLKKKISTAPHAPGVYLFKDVKNKIVYIGKAGDLNKRLTSYINKKDSKGKILLQYSKDLDLIITNSDTQALTLEESLIKLNKPRFNVRLKDDKKFPFLKITVNDEFPRIIFTREIGPDGSLIFGPYTNARALRQTRDALCRIFKLVSCKKDLSKKYPRPCLEFSLGRCSAPCSGNIEQDAYQVYVKKAIKFLRGNSLELEKEIEKAMWRCAEKENFEAASLLRNQLLAIRKISQRQQVVTDSMTAHDIIGISRSRSLCIACLFRIRESRLSAKEIFKLAVNPDIDDKEIASSFIRQIYTHVSFVPKEIIIASIPADWKIQKKWFKEKGFTVSISIGRTGEKKYLLDWAQKNAANELAKTIGKKSDLPALTELQDTLKLNKVPRWVEAFDISNLKEKFCVGSSVSFYNGRPRKRLYRHYRIKRTHGQDDFAMINEIVCRRVKALKKAPSKPDLLLIDGGKGQLKAAMYALDIIDVDIPGQKEGDAF